MSFSSKINNKIDEIAAQAKEVQQRVADPSYHIRNIQEIVESALAEIEGLPDDPALLKREFVSVLSQVPGAVASTWSSAADDLKALTLEINRWKEMGEIYTEWQNAEAARVQREKEMKQEISSGEMREPSRHDAIRRQPGTRPAPTLGQFRRISSQLESGEDSEG